MKIYNKIKLRLNSNEDWETVEEDSYEWYGATGRLDGGEP